MGGETPTSGPVEAPNTLNAQLRAYIEALKDMSTSGQLRQLSSRVSLVHEICQGTEQEQDKKLQEIVQGLKFENISDLQLIDDVIAARLDGAGRQFLNDLKNPDAAKQQQIANGLLRDGLHPESVSESTPQERVLLLYFNTGLLKNPSLLNDLNTGKITTIDEFVRATLQDYKKFLSDNGLGERNFLPNDTFYRNLCITMQIDQRLVALNSISLNLAGFSENAERRIDEMQQRANEFLRLRDSIADHNSEEYKANDREYIRYSNAAGGLRNIRDQIASSDGRSSVLAALGGANYRPSGAILGGVSDIMDWVGSKIPTPGNFRDADVGSLLQLAGGVWCGAVAAMNFGSVGLAAGIDLKSAVGSLIGIPPKPLEAAGHVKAALMKVYEGIAPMGTGLLAFVGMHYTNLPEMEVSVRRFLTTADTELQAATGVDITGKVGEIARSMWDVTGEYCGKGKDAVVACFSEQYPKISQLTGAGRRYFDRWIASEGLIVSELERHYACQDEFRQTLRRELPNVSITLQNQQFDALLRLRPPDLDWTRRPLEISPAALKKANILDPTQDITSLHNITPYEDAAGLGLAGKLRMESDWVERNIPPPPAS